MDMQPQRQYAGKTNEELLRQYSVNPSFDLKQEIILRYIGVIRSAAIRMRDVYISFAQLEDIVSEGVITLMRSIDKFDPSMNVKFETFISKRIRGMIIDLARKQDWVPRTTRRNVNAIKEATEELSKINGREVDEGEVAKYMGIPLEKFREINSKKNMMSVLSLDLVLENAGEGKNSGIVPSGIESEQPEASYLNKELKAVLADGIRCLKENEQLVISLYYMEELNMKEIAQVMELSEPRISQIHSNAVDKLRRYIEDKM